MRPGFSLDSIVPDRTSSVALHQQLYQKLRGLIETRVLPYGAALPATRALAQDLRLGRNTVIAAYDQLALEGFLHLRRGTPPVVRELPVIARLRVAFQQRGEPAAVAARRHPVGPALSPLRARRHRIPPRSARRGRVSLQHLVAAADAAREAGAGRPFRNLFHHRLSRTARRDRTVSHGVARCRLRRRSGGGHERRAVVLRSSGAAAPRSGRQSLDGGAGLLRRRLGLRRRRGAAGAAACGRRRLAARSPGGPAAARDLRHAILPPSRLASPCRWDSASTSSASPTAGVHGSSRTTTTASTVFRGCRSPRCKA